MISSRQTSIPAIIATALIFFHFCGTAEAAWDISVFGFNRQWGSPCICDGHFVYDGRDGIVLYKIDGMDSSRISDTGINPTCNEEWILWQETAPEKKSLHLYNFKSRKETVLYSTNGTIQDIDLAGEWVIWNSLTWVRNTSKGWQIFIYNIKSRKMVIIDKGEHPKIDGTSIVYEKGIGDSKEIYLRRIGQAESVRITNNKQKDHSP